MMELIRAAAAAPTTTYYVVPIQAISTLKGWTGKFIEQALSSQIAPEKPLIAREYYIGNTRYIVTSMTKAGTDEDVATKVRRLIRNEVSRRADDLGDV